LRHSSFQTGVSTLFIGELSDDLIVPRLPNRAGRHPPVRMRMIHAHINAHKASVSRILQTSTILRQRPTHPLAVASPAVSIQTSALEAQTEVVTK
jgi:hypothetical protein